MSKRTLKQGYDWLDHFPGHALNTGVMIHIDAYVSNEAIVGGGSIVHARALVRNVEIGRDCIIGRDAEIHPFALIHDGVTIGDCTYIQCGAQIGRNARILQGVNIACGSEIDPGQVVSQDTIAITGTKWTVTLSEHGIKVGCHPILTPEAWEDLGTDKLDEIEEGSGDYHECLWSVISLWHSFFEWK